MTKRLSLADLKAKATASVIQNTEIYTGGEESGCHNKYTPILATQDVLRPQTPR
jgi:hypothetical protein